ncbi:hypothetical protein ACFLY7_02720, partial [Patescibacteria group bacterium]
MLKYHKKRIQFSWQEGILADYWSMVHLLTGVVLGLVTAFFGFSFLVSVIVVFMVMVLWEFFEILLNIGETLSNRFIDVMTSMVVFPPVFIYAPENSKLLIALIIILVIILLILDYYGWKNY